MKHKLAAWMMASLVTVAAGVVSVRGGEAPCAGGLQEVESTVIKAIAYDEASEALTIEFVSGETYVYAGVPKAVYEALMAAESKGEYFQGNIKGRYEFSKK